MGSNDLLMGDVLRRHEMQVWFLAEHVVDSRSSTRSRPPGLAVSRAERFEAAMLAEADPALR